MNRTEARAAAMKLIYEWDMGGVGGEDTLEGILEIAPNEVEYDYMRRMVDGTMEQVQSLDQQIQHYAQGWTLARLPKVDLAILRLAAYELALGEVPPNVAVNEAVALSHLYSSEKAGSFINGVLGSITRAKQK